MFRFALILALLLFAGEISRGEDRQTLIDNFDGSRKLRKGDVSFQVDRAAALIPPTGTGGLRHRLGVNIHSLTDDHGLDLAKEAGFSFVRMDLHWARLEQHGKYNFAPFDSLMHALEARGMGVLWLIAYGHPEHGGDAPRSKEDVEAYSRYAAAVVSHFRGHNARFEIWNEPNLKQFLANTAIYPKLLASSLDAIRRQDANAEVSTGGTSGFDFPFLTRILKSGSAKKASAIAVHPYRESGPETLNSDLLLLRGLIDRAGARNMPIWDTEWGYSSSGKFSRDGHGEAARKRQAVFAVRECLTVWALGLPVAVWYDLRDDGPNPFDREHNFGILDQDGSEKPAMRALRVLTNSARSHTYAGLVRDVPKGLHAMRLDGADDTVFIVWNDDVAIPARLRFTRDEEVSVTNLFGERIMVGDEIVLEEGIGPVYVRLKRH